MLYSINYLTSSYYVGYIGLTLFILSEVPNAVPYVSHRKYGLISEYISVISCSMRVRERKFPTFHFGSCGLGIGPCMNLLVW